MSVPPSTPASPAPGAFGRSEPIPGYRIIDLLGRGGYGEVWRAIAPGGIPKALKVVFGGKDASQAEAELRAVARIKDVRHPLLLSIERVEVVDGNLVIVTELADCSLKEHYLRLRKAQSIGVPQMELLRYVADTAEALDFLYESHSLQHLDVKPENILLISNRAKLGDFGLVKHLYERSASLVGGLTPTYAPPELFEGKPNRNSDQYSLALVYMQMLTGTLPFIASNTAQIAAQHLHGVPDLSTLPKAQRPVIARALSKDPSHRFESCLAMVAALQESLRSTEAPAPAMPSIMPRSAIAAPSPSYRGHGESKPATAADAHLGDGDALSRTMLTSKVGLSSPVVARRADQLSPPVVLIGVGGAGTDVLAGVLNRLHDRCGSRENWPSVEFVALDSSVRPLNARFREEDLAHVQVVPIPLKATEAYSERSSDYLRWISRRWLYNISRDLTTGGYRPLGRLALLTNGLRVRDALRAVAKRIAETHGTSGPPPRILLVGSLCGGTGSGAILDLSYAIRGELKQAGLSDEQIHGLLLYGTARSNLERDKARANAYSALSELSHYSSPGSHYPGEIMLGVAPFHGNNATFTRTHLINLGDCPGEAGWKFATEQVAEFVYASSFTQAAGILQGNPDASAGAASESRPTELATYRLLSLNLDGTRTVALAVQSACQDVIKLWQEGRRTPSDAQSERTARINTFSRFTAPQETPTAASNCQLTENQIDLEHLLQDAAAGLQQETGTDADPFTQKLIDDSLEIVPAAQGADGNRETMILAMIDRYLRCDFREGYDNLSNDQLFTQILNRLAAQTRLRVRGLLDWIRWLVDSPETRIEGARRNAIALQQSLQGLQEQTLAQAAALHRAAQGIAAEIRATLATRGDRSRFTNWSFRKRNPDDGLRELLVPYARARLEELLHRAIAKQCRSIETEVGTLIEQLHRFSKELAMIAGPQRGPHASTSQENRDELPEGFAPAVAAYRQLLKSQLEHRRSLIAGRIDELMEERIRADGVGLRRFLESQTELQVSLGAPLTEVARQVVLENIQRVNCDLLSACASGQATAGVASESISDLIVLISRSMEEHFSGHADSTGRVLIVPEEADATLLRKQLQSPTASATILPARKCDVTLCSVRQRVPLELVAREIIEGIDLYKELASRLHSRIDVAWQPFVAAPSLGRSERVEGASSSTPVKTSVIPGPANAAAATPQDPQPVSAGRP